ncbi:PadR family transcriptional regulator [Thalassotalea nanhaiensis]|uniref:PadR family transcriptional regulator n=1 Tax=Thalassotalea nanhaiensis TaxID=3065648 RepID=A0ABY9TFG4_9GAMM|nr:PadR family transcriptional regulator [Colwelliaceae bacterium SQ345]
MIKASEETLQHVKKFQKELNTGTVALVLLSILKRAKKPLYGYEISKLLDNTHGEKQSAIYPVLRSLSEKGLLNSKVKPSDSGPPRKYFTISTLGKAVLKEWVAIWKEKQSLVDQILGEPHE